ADEVKKMTDANKVGLDQNSLLLYVTQPFADTKNKTGKYELIDQAGYYYYDAKDNGGKWKRMSESESLWENISSQNIAKLKTLSDGTTERTDDKNVFISDEGNIGSGIKSPLAPFHVQRVYRGKELLFNNDILYDYYDNDTSGLGDPFTISIMRSGGTPEKPKNLRTNTDIFSLLTFGQVNEKSRVPISSLYTRYKGDGTNVLSDYQISVSGGGNPSLYIEETQNVGLGTFNPTEKLDINGKIRIRATGKGTCSEANRGTIVYDTDDNFYGCKSTGWVKLNP
ncbi:hypothetical protein ACT720_01655, partial [Ornithobacterium rhinotracheale]